MLLLHTADWHLGQRLCEQDRKEEHDHFLQWLRHTLTQYRPDALVVAGDVFDVGYPAKYAEMQYYNFLKEAFKICPNIIITGGNHDAPNALNAPRKLLSALNVHVIGGALANPTDEIITVVNRQGKTIGAVAAVPFLREGDVRTLQAGENYTDKIAAYKQGIAQRYQLLAHEMMTHKNNGLPIIATGHLYAAGSAVSDTEDREMHIIGNQGQMEVEIFPAEFDYIALGHIHKPQIVSGRQHIRYSGSPIPLSFSERNDAKQVLLVQFEQGRGLVNIEALPVPLYRRLHRFKGSFEAVQNQLAQFEHNTVTPSCWAEIHLQLNNFTFNYEESIKQLAKDRNIDILKFPPPKLQTNTQTDAEQPESADMELLQNYAAVFKAKCKASGVNPQDMPELEYTFSELLQNMNDEL